MSLCMSFGDFLSCPYVNYKITSFIISNLLETITHLPNSSVRETVRETAVGVVHSYLSCWLSFPLCRSLFPSPPSSSCWVFGTFSDSKSLAPSQAGSLFHSLKCVLTIIKAVSALTFCY